MKKTVCVDLDGVLAQYDGWKGETVIGDPIPGAVDFVRELLSFAKVVIHTTRANTDVGARFVEDWLHRRGLRGDHGYVELWRGCGEPIAAAYVDDRAVVCRPQSSNRDFMGFDEGGGAVDNEWFDAALYQCRKLCND